MDNNTFNGDPNLLGYDWFRARRQQILEPVRGTQIAVVPQSNNAKICGRSLDESVMVGGFAGLPIVDGAIGIAALGGTAYPAPTWTGSVTETPLTTPIAVDVVVQATFNNVPQDGNCSEILWLFKNHAQSTWTPWAALPLSGLPTPPAHQVQSFGFGNLVAGQPYDFGCCYMAANGNIGAIATLVSNYTVPSPAIPSSYMLGGTTIAPQVSTLSNTIGTSTNGISTPTTINFTTTNQPTDGSLSRISIWIRQTQAGATVNSSGTPQAGSWTFYASMGAVGVNQTTPPSSAAYVFEFTDLTNGLSYDFGISYENAQGGESNVTVAFVNVTMPSVAPPATAQMPSSLLTNGPSISSDTIAAFNNAGTANPSLPIGVTFSDWTTTLPAWLLGVRFYTRVHGTTAAIPMGDQTVPSGTNTINVTLGLGAATTIDIGCSYLDNSGQESQIAWPAGAWNDIVVPAIGPNGILSIGGPNLVPDSQFQFANFKNGIAGSDPYWNFYLIDGESFYIGIQNNNSGSNYLGIRPGDSGKNCKAQSEVITIQPNTFYTVSAYIDASTCHAGPQPYIAIVSTDQSTQYAVAYQTIGQQGVVSATWTSPATLDGSNTAPTQVTVMFNSNAANVNSSILVFATPMLQVGKLGPYTPGPVTSGPPATNPPPAGGSGGGAGNPGAPGGDPSGGDGSGSTNYDMLPWQIRMMIAAANGGDGSYFTNGMVFDRHIGGVSLDTIGDGNTYGRPLANMLVNGQLNLQSSAVLNNFLDFVGDQSPNMYPSSDQLAGSTFAGFALASSSTPYAAQYTGSGTAVGSTMSVYNTIAVTPGSSYVGSWQANPSKITSGSASVLIQDINGTQMTPTGSYPYWIMQTSDANFALQNDAAISFWKQNGLSVLYPAGSTVPNGWKTIGFRKYDSLAAFESDIANNVFPDGTTTWVGYDPESWYHTPVSEWSTQAGANLTGTSADNWSSTKQYNVNDVCFNGAQAWVCTATNTGQTPSASSAYWAVIIPDIPTINTTCSTFRTKATALGLSVVVMPSSNLCKGLITTNPYGATYGSQYAAMTQYKGNGGTKTIPETMAQYCDWYHVQNQGFIFSANITGAFPSYQTYLTTVRSLVLGINAGLRITCGLTTQDPNGAGGAIGTAGNAVPTANTLAAINAALPYVNGFWYNTVTNNSVTQGTATATLSTMQSVYGTFGAVTGGAAPNRFATPSVTIPKNYLNLSDSMATSGASPAWTNPNGFTYGTAGPNGAVSVAYNATGSSRTFFQDAVPVTPGQRYTFSVWCNPSAITSGNVQIHVRTSGSTTTLASQTIVAGAAGRSSVSYTVPNGVTLLRFGWGTNTAVGTSIFSQPMLEQATVASGFYISSQIPQVQVVAQLPSTAVVSNGGIFAYSQPMLRSDGVVVPYTTSQFNYARTLGTELLNGKVFRLNDGSNIYTAQTLSYSIDQATGSLKNVGYASGLLQPDGSVHNVDGQSCTTSFSSSVAGDCYVAEGTIQRGVTSSIGGFTLGGPYAITAGNYCYGAAIFSDGSFQVFKIVNGTFTALASSGNSGIYFNDTNQHSIQIGLIVGSTNVIEATCDGYAVEVQDNAIAINSVSMYVYTGGNAGNVRNSKFGKLTGLFSQMPSSYRQNWNWNGNLLTSAGLLSNGAVVPVVSTSGISYISSSGASSTGTSTITFYWDGTNGSTIPTYHPPSQSNPATFTAINTTGSGSPSAQTGLNASTTYYYCFRINMTSNTLELRAQSGGAAANSTDEAWLNTDGYVPFAKNLSAATPAVNTGGGGGSQPGGGGGGNFCPSVDQIIETQRGFVDAGEVIAGDYLRDPDGDWNEVYVADDAPATILEVTVGGETLRVEWSHQWMRPDGSWIAACDLKIGTLLQGVDACLYGVEALKHCGDGRMRKFKCRRSRYVLGRVVGHNTGTF